MLLSLSVMLGHYQERAPLHIHQEVNSPDAQQALQALRVSRPHHHPRIRRTRGDGGMRTGMLLTHRQNKRRASRFVSSSLEPPGLNLLKAIEVI